MKPVAYEGNEPYIFVSYAHRDSEQVFEVLNELQGKGYRLWYDDGIAPGSEWPEDIARHLDGAAMVIAFVTPNSMRSQNCRREINFSLSREKPFLSVLLEETDMPLGMQMQLSAQQSILRYNYDSWEGFIKKILACPDIKPCMEQAPVEPKTVTSPEPDERLALSSEPAETAPASDLRATRPTEQPSQEVAKEQVSLAEPHQESKAVPASTPASDEYEYHHVELVPPAEEPKAAKRTLPKPDTAKEGQLDAASSASGKKASGKKLAIPLAVGAVLLLAVLGFVFSRPATSSFTTSWGKEISKSESYLDVSGRTLEQSDLEGIAAMESLTSLGIRECDLSQCDFSKVSFASPELDKFDFSGSTGLSDFSFLSGRTLQSLKVAGLADFKDLSALDVTALETLDVSGTGVTDLSALEGAPLMTLNFSDTAVSDISVLSTMAKLHNVNGANTKVTSIDALATLSGLETVDFSGCELAKLSQPFASLKISKLYLSGTGISGFDNLSDLTMLKELDLSQNANLTDMDWLDQQNYQTLTKLNLSQTGLAADDVSWVAQCTGLTELRLDGIALGKLAVCDGLENLKYLSAVNCALEDISGLATCTKLGTIQLGCNRIADVSALAGLDFASRVDLDLTSNALETVEALPAGKYQTILLLGNADKVAGTLPEGVSVYQLATPWFEEICSDTLKESVSTLYVTGCPQNKVLKMQEFFGYRLKLLSEDELWELYANGSFEYSTHMDGSYLLSVLRS